MELIVSAGTLGTCLPVTRGISFYISIKLKSWAEFQLR